jgi:hypothetical protein
MLNKVLANQAEQIAVTPDQAAFVLKNKSDFKNKLDVDVSMYNTNIANSFINNKLQNNPDWNKYLQDPFRRNNPDYKRWKSVEDLMSEQENTSIAEKYGDNLAKQADIVLDYVKPKNIWDRTAMGYNAARYGLRYAAARKDLSDALEAGDETKITEARNKMQEELFNLQYNSYEFESDTLNTGASIAASIARNLPAMIGSDLAITAASGLVSGGIGAVVGGARAAKRVAEIGKAAKLTAEGIRAARIAKKAAKIAKVGVEASKTVARGGIIFGDTYKIESGSILQELDRSHPELSEDQKRDLAHAGGIINAAIETIPMVMGVGFQAGMSKVLSKATTNAMLKSGVGSKVVSNPTFLREFKKQVEKNAFNFKKFTGDVAIDMVSNGIQEVLQDCIQKATEYVIDNPDTSVLEAGWDLFTDFVENPLADRNAEMLKTLMNVMIVSPVFSAAPTIVDTTIKQIGSGSMYKKAAGAQKNRKLADDLNKWAKDNEVNSVAPSVVNNNLANMVKNGDAPATVYFDVKSVQEALQSSEAEVQEAMQKLNMATRYEESKTNGGTIEMTLPEYNELVNQEKSGKLFQIVRSMVSFDPNSLSSAEFLRYMTTDGKALSVLEGAMEDSESAYNKSYNKFIESGWDEKQARFDATLAQLVSNRLASVTGGGMTGSEYFAKNIDIRTGQEQPSVALPQHMQESFDIADQNAKLDAENKPYNGDTINIDGVERPTKNSEGKPIAKSEPALRNFWNWFGDSKVVDEDGRPLVVYHGSPTLLRYNEDMLPTINKTVKRMYEYKGISDKFKEIKIENVYGWVDTIRKFIEQNPDFVVSEYDLKNLETYKPFEVFDIGRSGETTGSDLGSGIFFTDSKESAQTFEYIIETDDLLGDKSFRPGTAGTGAFYLKIENPNITKDLRNKTISANKAKGYDGIINTMSQGKRLGKRIKKEYVVFEPNQIKSTENRGTFDPANPNVYYQFVGSRKEETVNDIADKLGKRAELDQARAMEKESVDKGEMPDYEAIWSQTGWYKEADTSWSYEISDSEIKINESANVVGSDGSIIKKKEIKLSELIDHPKLFNFMPVLKNLNVSFYSDENRTYKRGRYSRMDFTIYMNSAAFNNDAFAGRGEAVDSMLDTLVHEIQHALQWELDMMRFSEFEGYKGVRNSRMTPERKEKLRQLDAAMMDLYELNKQDKFLPARATDRQDYFASRNKMYDYAKKNPEAKPIVDKFVDLYLETKDYNIDAEADHVQYLRLSYEMQARNTTNRRKLTSEQTRVVSPSSTTDIAGKVQVGTVGKSKEALQQNTRELRTIRFTGIPELPMGTTGTEVATPQGKEVAGWFEREGDKLIVNLTKAVNPTTFSHEMFHAFSNVLMEQYNNGRLSKYWKRQAENLFESVGAKPDADGKVVLTKTQEEHLADQFTTYILEGKVPSAEVSSIFALIKDWFKKAYLDFGIRHLGLNKKVIEVFDSIFMAQEEVEQRQRALAMIEFPMPEGADQGLYDKYVSHLLNSRAKASAKLVRAWYGLQKYKTSKEYTKRRGDIYNAVRSELEQSIAYQYQAILDKNNGDHVAAYNEYIGKHPEALESETPITPEVLQEMVDNLPTIDQEANRLTQQQIDEEMAVKFKIDKEPAANKALRNTEKVKALLAEALLHEGKKLSDFEAEYSAFLDNAERIIAKLSISAKKNTKGIRNFTYWVNQEGMAVERYAYAYAQQDKAEMAQQRRNQALFTMIRIRGEEIDNRAMRFKTQFQEKLRGNQKKEIINKDTGERADLYTADAWDLMQSIIEKFGFKIISKARTNKTVAEKMEDWIKDQENKSMTTIGFLRNFIPFIGKGYEGEFSQMSVNMFEQLENIMTAVNAVARTEQFVIREGEKLHMNELKRDVVQTLEQKGIKPTTKAQGWLGKTFGGLGKWTNPEPVLQAFFSEKVLNAVFRPFFSAAATADSKGNSWIAQYRKARDKIKLTGEYTTYSNGVRLTDAQVVDLFLSMGTQHAYENFIKAFRINEEQAEQVVSEALTANPELANFVTEYWNLMSEAADAMNESHKKRMNRVLVRKEPRAFTINGIQFTGGYVPENKGLLREISEGDYNSLQMGLLSNEKEITKEADGTVKSIIDNTESRLGLFAKWAYAAPEYNNICKFMSDPEVKETVGEGLTEFIFNWLWAFQTPSVDTSGVVRPLTSLVSVAALGFRSMQGLIQLSGLVPAVATIGAKNVVFGLRKTIMTGDIFNPIKNARGKSAYMANRYDNPMGSILGFDKKDIKRTKLGDVYQRAGMSIIALFDAVVSSAVWEGAYADGISQGLSEQEATLKADAAVRVSQTDSMAASRSQALQSPWARAITSFATYIMGMQSVVRANLAAGERFKAALFAVNYMVFATFFESMYREAVNVDDEDDDKKYIERVRTRWYNDMVKTLGSSAIPAFGFGGSVSAALASGIEKAFDVEDEIFESYAPSSALHTYLSQMYYLAQNVPAALVGDEEAQAKAIVNSIGLVSSEGKKIAKEWLNQ